MEPLFVTFDRNEGFYFTYEELKRILTIAVGIAVLSFYFTYEELKHIDTINDELSWCEFLLYL